MGFNVNIFHILADVSHTVSKGILIWAIHSNRSAEGVSLITQALYALVFCARYLDLFTTRLTTWLSYWNFILKIFYITSSFYIIFVMMRVYARTREREKAWKLGAWSLGGSAALTMPLDMIFKHAFTFKENFWIFSQVLESVAVLPQLLLLRQTTVPTVLDSFYLVTLGSYRAFYILNWIVRAAYGDKPDAISVIFGVIQTALYADFAWVYFTRQRVKLRGGAVIDSDDFSQGWVVKRLLGRKAIGTDDLDEEEAPALGGDANGNGHARATPSNKWGQRGISISADDDVHDIHRDMDEDARPLADPAAFDDEDEDDEDDSDEEDNIPDEVGNGSEWRQQGKS